MSNYCIFQRINTLIKLAKSPKSPHRECNQPVININLNSHQISKQLYQCAVSAHLIENKIG